MCRLFRANTPQPCGNHEEGKGGKTAEVLRYRDGRMKGQMAGCMEGCTKNGREG